MKTDRHKKILEVIDRYEVGTQEELAKKLEERGFMLLTVDELFAKDGVTLEANQAYWRCLDGVTTQY